MCPNRPGICHSRVRLHFDVAMKPHAEALAGNQSIAFMQMLTNLIVAIACVILIFLVMLLYLRSRQGDQRIIQATNRMFLPLLSAIVITLGIIYNNTGNVGCMQGIPNILRYVAAIGAVLIVLVGVIRYAISQNRDRRLITHPTLFAIDFVLVIFIIEILSGCM